MKKEENHAKYVPLLCSQAMLWISVVLVLLTGCASSSSTYLTLFSQGESRYDGHAWSLDGQWLASESTDGNILSLFSSKGQLVKNLDVGCELGGGIQDFSWLPDGRISCMNANNPNQILDIFSINQKGEATLSTTVNTPLVPYTFVYALQWNPHHNWLAILADKIPGQTAPFLYITDLEGRNLIIPLRIDAEIVAWSPDGTRLALVKQNGDIQLFNVEIRGKEQLVLSGSRTLAAGTTTTDTIAWSPSGKWLLCRHGSYQSEDYLFLLASDGSGKQVKLTSSNTDGQLDYPAWSPDGKRVIVGRVSDGTLMSLDIAAILKEKGVSP